LENRAFYHNIILITFFGFIIHHFLPDRYRLPFFLLLTLSGIIGVLGIPNGIWLVVIGSGLIGICHLPVAHRIRIVILLLAGITLAAFRADWIDAPWSIAIWPILASLFMFRLIIYMYDLKHQARPAGLWQTLSYFFLLPNIVFPFFPVVDYSVFHRTYFDEERNEIYRKGVEWMLRGVTHLIVYRFIYYYLVLPPEEVIDTGDLVRFLVSNFLLYLRISGMFHLTVGMLHLFGFNLPETNHRYCLSSSFIDFWRRINIYWKDFMQKVFFNPISFRLRHLGLTTSLVMATIFVFLATWALHSYQWFWIRGAWLLTPTDIIFWMILALLVVANFLITTRFVKKRARGERRVSIGDSASLVIRTLGTFAAVCVLWSLWTSASFSEWFSLWPLRQTVTADAVILSSILLAALIALVHFSRTVAERGWLSISSAGSPSFTRFAMWNGLLIFLLYLPTTPSINVHLGENARELVRNLQTNKLSRRDEELMVRGYYEDLTNVNRFNSQLWEVYMLRPEEWPDLWDVDAVRLTGDFLRYELRPSLNIIFKNEPLRTNRWGMRDQDYEKEPSPHTFRIALTGASHTMGSGVGDDETFEFLLENRLNRENPENSKMRYEILNFGVDGYNPLQQLVVLETKVLLFQPNCYLYVAHEGEGKKSLGYLVERARDNAKIPYGDLIEILQKAEIAPKMTKDAAMKRMQPYENEIITWIYRRIVRICREHGIPAVCIFLPDKVGISEAEDAENVVRIAEEAGFYVLNLSDIYDDQDAEALRVTSWDMHPNASGHRLIADYLYEMLRQKKGIIPELEEQQ